VVGYIALFCFVLGGTAVALPGKNKVDTGDIKRNGVRASDIAPRAVTAAKIAPRSVDGLRVIDNSLTGEDIDESTLNVRPAPSSIGPTELADRQRRLVFTPGMLVSGGTGEEPKLEVSGPFPVLSFVNNANGFASLATDVPGSRVEGTRMTVRVVWNSNNNGTADWTYAYESVATGGDVGSAPLTEGELQSPTTSGQLSAASFDIPAGAVSNGDLLGLTIERVGTNVNDTLPGDARLLMIEIDYTATG
jgi:hypothetical protein